MSSQTLSFLYFWRKLSFFFTLACRSLYNVFSNSFNLITCSFVLITSTSFIIFCPIYALVCIYLLRLSLRMLSSSVVALIMASTLFRPSLELQMQMKPEPSSRTLLHMHTDLHSVCCIVHKTEVLSTLHLRIKAHSFG